MIAPPSAAHAPALLDRAEHPRVAEPPAVQAAGASDVRLSVHDVTARYGSKTALDGVSMAVGAGEIICLLGPSGSGKSTLLRLIAGLERPCAGTIAIDGLEVAGPHRFVESERRRAGMVFQDYALFPHLTVAANVAFGLRGWTRADADRAVVALLDRLGLRHYAASYPHMLSGGERQRVALARALAPGPRLLLMDEPFSSLDNRLRDRVRDDTVRLLRETATTTVIVTHDPGEAMRIADRVVLLHEGRVIQDGAPAEMYACPKTLFAARFFSEINELPGIVRGGWADSALGLFEAPHLATDGDASVCVRPQHVHISAVPTRLQGTVAGVAFLGLMEQIDVLLPNVPTPLMVRSVSRTGLRRGDRVSLAIAPGDILVFPRAHVPAHPTFTE